jgi:hypothetical protein
MDLISHFSLVPATILASVLVIFLFLLINIERIGLKVLRARGQLPSGLHRSLERVTLELGFKKPPKVRVIPELDSWSMVLTSLGSRGTICITQGFLATASDADLDRILKNGLFQLNRFGMSVLSLRGLLFLGLIRALPTAWTQEQGKKPLSVGSAVGFWIFSSLFSLNSTPKNLIINS